MKIYKLNNIKKRQQQQKLTNMTSNFQYKKSLWTSTWHKKNCCLLYVFLMMLIWLWIHVMETLSNQENHPWVLLILFFHIYICSNASINLQPQIILINYSQYHKVVYKYQSYWWTVNKSYLWRIKKTNTSIMI